MVAGSGRGQPDLCQLAVIRDLERTWQACDALAARTGRGTTRRGGRRKVIVSIAVPTGALLAGSLRLLTRAHVARITAAELGRKLMIERRGLRVILVRPADVPAYVDNGAADLGVVGKDMLWESEGAHYELVDLGFGACRMVMAVPAGSGLSDPASWPPLLRLATKYPRTTAAYFEKHWGSSQSASRAI